MILANIIHDKQSDRITSFSLSGHADSGEYGKDIVCAAVSVLSISTVNGLTEVANLEPKVVNDDIEGGFMEVTVPEANSSEDEIAAQAILSTFQNGMRDISQSYADYIKLDITID
ncbi:ribosomal-processing cysteine protease Prp [Apilactobacillus kunkeei]|uniref:Ribosomal processing cysteine protease Prp n=1 Tax=Apilactobacillus nanyangensis TaxID=2799579 RepID=A0ABT0HY09_9LACO|nr:ribosomal-processing cysteine protease Prp [Apilactobacillus nanyangensis]MCK8611808.1 ribosomal-processing cysteine protease Prp [Apilactobacillus nanyangensis]TMT01650.1 ribosomal-processing cysteine protease Prp [Apilactobacillus kunkeei]TMT03791.1 ribosomal-processing cysteine protease Prp [Apilactobacillus kunkeei]